MSGRRFSLVTLRIILVATGVGLSVFLVASQGLAVKPDEILRYDVLWNGTKAGHGDITTIGNSDRVKVIVQAVSDGALKAIIELWSRIQATFGAQSFRPETYSFHLKSNLLASETVELAFDHHTGLVSVNKQKGRERESHAEKFAEVYDPVTAAYFIRKRKDYSQPAQVDIYDGKGRARLFMSPANSEGVTVKGGIYPGLRIELKLVRLTGDKKEMGTGTLWISDDPMHIPLLLTSSHTVGTIRFELVQAVH